MGLRLGSLFGAPIYVAPSWLIFLGWVTIAFAPLVEDNVAGKSRASAHPATALSPATAAAILIANCPTVGDPLVPRGGGVNVPVAD